MTRVVRAVQLGLCLAVALCFAGFAAMAFATAGPPASAVEGSLVLLVLAAPALVATWVIVGAVSRRVAERAATWPSAPPDAPGVLVALAASLIPEERQDFGTAMVAELGAVEGRARWSFALGCVRASLQVPPRGVGVALRVAGLLGVVALVTTAVRLAVVDDAGSVGAAHWVVLGVVAVAGLGLTLALPTVLAHDRRSLFVGLTGAGLLAGGFLLSSGFPSGANEGVASFLVLAPAVTLFLVGVVTAFAGRSLRRGVESVLCTTLLGVVALFVLYLVEAERWYGRRDGLLLDAHRGASLVANVEDAVLWVVLFVPMWAMPFGLLGAAAGAKTSRWRPWRSATVATSDD